MAAIAENKLAKFIVDDLFDWFRSERNTLLEPQMRRNYDAFRGRYDSEALKRWKSTEGTDWRSKVFVRFTKQKVVTGFNQVMSIYLQGGDLPWDLTPSPIAQSASGRFLPAADAKARCSGMKLRIKDDFGHAKIVRKFMSSTMENCLYGFSWLRSPVLRPFARMGVEFAVPGAQYAYPPAMVRQYGRHQLVRQNVSYPVIENPSVWNVFWDLETPDHQQGQGMIIRDMMSKGRLLDLMDVPGFDKTAIQQLYDEFATADDKIESADEDDSQGPVREQFNQRRRVIPVYSFYGRVPRKHLVGFEKTTGRQIRGLSRAEGREVEIYCVCAKGAHAVVLRPPVLNPLSYRPLHKATWESLPNEAGGLGIPEDMEDSQMIINGLTRAMLDNKALASNLMMFWNPRAMAPGQNKTLYPGKAFEVEEGVEDVRQALQFYSPPDNTRGIPDAINLFRDFADHETGLSRTMDGQMTDPGRRTAYEMSQMAESGNKLIGGVIRNTDEGQMEPIVTGHYHYHMLTNPDDSIKGDFSPVAKGFQSFQEKAKRGQNLRGLMQLSLSNQFTAQFTKVLPFLREIAAAHDLDPERYYPTDKELQEKSDGLTALLPNMSLQPMAAGAPSGGVI